jgi:hypothetical protein
MDTAYIFTIHGSKFYIHMNNAGSKHIENKNLDKDCSRFRAWVGASVIGCKLEPVGSKIFGPGPDLLSIFGPGPD